MHIYIIFHILFHYDLSQDTECSYLCYTVEPSYLFTHICSLPLLISNSHSFPPLPTLPGNHKPVLYTYEYVLLHRYVDLYYILILHISDIIWCLSFSFWLTLLSMIISMLLHWHYCFLFYGWVVVYLCTTSPNTHWSMDIEVVSMPHWSEWPSLKSLQMTNPREKGTFLHCW